MSRVCTTPIAWAAFFQCSSTRPSKLGVALAVVSTGVTTTALSARPFPIPVSYDRPIQVTQAPDLHGLWNVAGAEDDFLVLHHELVVEEQLDGLREDFSLEGLAAPFDVIERVFPDADVKHVLQDDRPLIHLLCNEVGGAARHPDALLECLFVRVCPRVVREQGRMNIDDPAA